MHNSIAELDHSATWDDLGGGRKMPKDQPFRYFMEGPPCIHAGADWTPVRARMHATAQNKRIRYNASMLRKEEANTYIISILPQIDGDKVCTCCF